MATTSGYKATAHIPSGDGMKVVFNLNNETP